MDEIMYIDWDENERLIVSNESNIREHFQDDDDIHQFSDYQHSFVELDNDR